MTMIVACDDGITSSGLGIDGSSFSAPPAPKPGHQAPLRAPRAPPPAQFLWRGSRRSRAMGCLGF
jgi:hypothetical protein